MGDLWLISWLISWWFHGDFMVIYGWFQASSSSFSSALSCRHSFRPTPSPASAASSARSPEVATALAPSWRSKKKRFWWKKTQKKTGKNREMSGKHWENQENLGKWCGQVEKVRKTSWSHQQKFSINLQEAIWFYPRIYRFLWMFSPRLGDDWEWLRPPIHMVILGMVYDIVLTTL